MDSYKLFLKINKMPIIYICSDGKNETLRNFLKEINNKIDSIYFSCDQYTSDFVDFISENVNCKSLLMMVNLNEDPVLENERICNCIKMKRQGNFMIICKKEIMKLFRSKQNYDEWDSVSLN
jgi:hypothetical protein